MHSRSKIHANPSNNSMNPIDAAARRNLFTSYAIRNNHFTKILSFKSLRNCYILFFLVPVIYLVKVLCLVR